MNWSEVVDAAVTTVFDGPLLAAGLVAVAAGLVSFASPCVLPLLPGYLGYLGGMVGAAGTAGRGARGGTTRRGGSRTSTRTPTRTSTRTRPAGSRRRLLLGVALFIAGFSAVFVGLGVVFAMAGLRLAAYTDVILRVAGVLVILLGLAFTGLVPFLQRERRLHVDPRSAGLWGAPLPKRNLERCPPSRRRWRSPHPFDTPPLVQEAHRVAARRGATCEAPSDRGLWQSLPP